MGQAEIQEFIRRNRLGNLDIVGPGLPDDTFQQPPGGIPPLPPGTPTRPRESVQMQNPGAPMIPMDAAVPESTPLSDPEYASALEALRAYKPDTRASDRLDQLLNEYPEHTEPSIIRKIVASGIGLKHGGKAAMDVMHQPHEEALADWAAKITPANQAATQERGANANERSILATIASTEGLTRRYDLAEKKQRDDNEIQKSKQALEKLKYEHPDFKFDYSGPTVIASDPRTGNSRLDTGIKTGHLSDIDKIEKQTQGRIDVVEAQGAQNRQTNAEKPPTGTSGRNAQLEQNRTRQELYDNHPDGRKWLIKKSDGTFELKKRPTEGGYFGATPEEIANYDAFRKLLYPNWNGGVQPTNTAPEGTTVGSSTQPNTRPAGSPQGRNTGTPRQPATNAPKYDVPPGTVLLQKIADGALMTLPESQYKAFMAEPENRGKYVRVQ